MHVHVCMHLCMYVLICVGNALDHQKEGSGAVGADQSWPVSVEVLGKVL